MIRAFLIVVCLTCTASVCAAKPILALYVTADGRDGFAALNAGTAFELAGCSGLSAARALLQLDETDPVLDTTQSVLEANHALGQHPPLPCTAAALSTEGWPPETRIWAELTGNPIYYLALPGADAVYVLHSRCEVLRETLGVRARLQGSGFQGIGASPLPARATLDCGNASRPVDENETDVVETPLPDTWRLARALLLLEPPGGVQSLFIARHSRDGAAGAGNYLPIWQLDGEPVAELFIGSASDLAEAEARLKSLFGVPEDTPVKLLGAQDLPFIQQALFLDLCLTADCSTYEYRHAYFDTPGASATLVSDDIAALTPRMTLMGETVLGLAFDGDRSLGLADCDMLASAMGLTLAEPADWVEAADAAIAAETGNQVTVNCANAVPTCIRTVPENGIVTRAMQLPGPDCPGARRLQLDLPASSRAPFGIEFGPGGFERVRLQPGPGVAAPVVLNISPVLSSTASPCSLSSQRRLIGVRGDVRLELHGVSIAQAGDGSGGAVNGIEVTGAEVALAGVEMVADGGGAQAVDHGVNLCGGTLYVHGGRIVARDTGVLSIGARALIGGGTSLSGDRFALNQSISGELRLWNADLVGQSAVVMRGGHLHGDNIRMQAISPGAINGHGVEFLGESSAEFLFSTAQDFFCVGQFWVEGSKLTFTLPGNDLATDNRHLSCPPDRTVVIE